MKAINCPFTKIINGTTQFVIPVFQRDYSWTEAHCEQLWKDVLQVGGQPTDRGHFLGSVVYLSTGDSSAAFTRWLLIDGQQRVTTITLLLTALRDRIQHAYFVDTKNPEYKAPWNQLLSLSRVFTPDDKAVQTPNSDTPYSFLGLDLRAEPVVLTVPPIEKPRYFSIQFIDAYTHNFDYVGSRATGNDGGAFLVVGPSWKGETPKGI